MKLNIHFLSHPQVHIYHRYHPASRAVSLLSPCSLLFLCGLLYANLGQCPVNHGQISSPSVVGDLFPDSTPHPSQRLPLPTTPVASSIPKGGADIAADATWIYPSQQRFYNAMKKKGWEPSEQDMQWIVGIHNTVNERAWQQVLRWEQQFHPACKTPKLVRFKGLPNQMSVKAKMLHWMG